ncbi:MAG TPA: 2-hydroxyacid dehydrogenase, partial [Phenylobacterium sp.]|nr:2-hydroxyacid dehydrogenase [Phenylobacterium sp.]
MLVKRPDLWGLERLGDYFDLRNAPGPGIRAVVTGGAEGIKAGTIDALPDLEIIAVCAVGYDATDVDHARARGVAVTNTPDVLTDDVADLALALMLAASRRIPQHDRYLRDGDWVSRGSAPLTRKLSGRRIGILGLGRIGLAIARRCEPFAGEIAYYNRSPRDDVPYRYAPDLVALAESVDILVIATSGGQQTAKLVNADVIAALGPDGMLVNIARGSIVDEDALVTALAQGRLGSAALDVFAQEPQVPEALIAMENVVLLPHQGSATAETRAQMGRLTMDNLHAHFGGRPLITPLW